jgi:hypothetical protein
VQDRIIDDSSSGRAMISAKYIEKYCENLDNSFFYLATCQSGMDSTLANAFVNKGAAAVIANTETIYTQYNLLMEYEVAHNLTLINDRTGNYYTLSEALSAAKEKYGRNDLVWYGENAPRSEAATPIIFGGATAENYCLADYSGSNENTGINYYEVFSNAATSWEDAEQYCESLGGHLATISSQEENEYVYQLMLDAGYKSAYFGMTDKDVEGTWVWVNGESGSYTNWHSGEPNHENANEDYAMFYYKFTDGTWNDGDFGGSTVNGGRTFICEWDTESAYNAYLAQ